MSTRYEVDDKHRKCTYRSQTAKLLGIQYPNENKKLLKHPKSKIDYNRLLSLNQFSNKKSSNYTQGGKYKNKSKSINQQRCMNIQVREKQAITINSKKNSLKNKQQKNKPKEFRKRNALPQQSCNQKIICIKKRKAISNVEYKKDEYFKELKNNDLLLANSQRKLLQQNRDQFKFQHFKSNDQPNNADQPNNIVSQRVIRRKIDLKWLRMIKRNNKNSANQAKKSSKQISACRFVVNPFSKINLKSILNQIMVKNIGVSNQIEQYNNRYQNELSICPFLFNAHQISEIKGASGENSLMMQHFSSESLQIFNL